MGQEAAIRTRRGDPSRRLPRVPRSSDRLEPPALVASRLGPRKDARGTEVDTAGDGFFATFDGPARGIRCALYVTERVKELGVEIRAGVHTGECEVVDGKVSGIAVSTGSRIASLAGPSEVLVSDTVKGLVAGSGFTFEDA